MTPLCRFRTNDEVDRHSRATTAWSRRVGKGDTHVVAFYDNGVAPVAGDAARVSDQVGPTSIPQSPTPTKIDELVLATSSASSASCRRDSAPTPNSSAA